MYIEEIVSQLILEPEEVGNITKSILEGLTTKHYPRPPRITNLKSGGIPNIW